MLLGAAASGQPPPGVGFDVPPPGTLSDRPLYVYGVAQDSTGYVWVASEDGLHRYDGVAFEPFRADPDRADALPGNRVTGVAVDGAGVLWAFVDRFGLVRVPPGGSVERVPLPPSLTENAILRGWARGSLFVATGDATLRYEAATGARRRLRAQDVHVAGGEALATADGSVVHYLGAGRWRTVWHGAFGTWVGGDRPGFLDEAGRLHVLGTDGAVRTRPTGLTDDEVRAIRAPLLDREGLLWFGAPNRPGATALRLATGERVRYDPEPGRVGALPAAPVIGLYEDREGVLWVATTLGLRTLGPGWAVFRTTPLPPTTFATVLAPGRDGRAWAGRACDAPALVGPDGGLVEADPLAARLGRAVAATGQCPVSVLEARDGTTWLAGWPLVQVGGLLRIGPGGDWAYYRSGGPGGLPSDAMRMAHEDARGQIWVATESGLARYRPEADAFDTFVHDPDDATSLPSSTIWTLADAPGGRLWVGTYTGGLALFDPEAGRVVRTFRADAGDPTSLSSDVVTVVHPSRAQPGVVWVGTYDGGLNRMDLGTGRFERWTRADGLPGLSVKSVLEDDDGRLWVGTDAGLVRLDPRSGRLRVYTEADGLPGVQFGLYDAAPLPGGRLAFAVGNALVSFQPRDVGAPAFRGTAVLRGLRVNGRSRPLPAPGAPIRLAPDERALGVEVAALSFSAPARTRYAVRLDGVDGAWTDLGADRSASWVGLPPGRHVLHVRAGTASGAWSPAELAVPVVVAPRWWERAWVRAGIVLLVLAGFALAVRNLSQRRLRREVARLEVERRVQDERERISRDLHDHVGAQLSSLLAGVELAKLARRARGARPEEAGGDAAGDPLESVESDARETIRQLRETIWALHDETLTAGAFCQRLDAYVKGRAKGRIGTLTVTCDGGAERPLPPAVALSLYRVAQEAVTNALKHSGARSLAVQLRPEADAITLVVEDDGRFVEPSGGDGLSGFGLGSMRTRVQQMGGTFNLDTTSGTRVRVRVPLDGRASPA